MPRKKSYAVSSRNSVAQSSAAKDEFRYEKFMELISAHEKSELLRGSFRQVYLEALVRECKSPQKALDRLLVCLKCHEKLKQIDEKMDKAFFEELVTSDYNCFTGATTPEGRPILWVRHGLHHQKCWSLTAYSGKFWAHVRASLFGGQAVLATMHDSPFPCPALFFDEGERTNLGFNLTLHRITAKLINDLFPIQHTKVVFFGCSPGTRVVMKAVNFALKGTDLTAISGVEVENLHPHVADKRGIPSYVIEEEDVEKDGNSGTTVDRKSPGNSWVYKRLVRGEGSIEAAEVFNPAPYVVSQSESEEEVTENDCSDYGALEAIEEDDEEEGDDW